MNAYSEDGVKAYQNSLSGSRAEKTLTKRDLSDVVYAKLGNLSRQDSHRLVGEVIEEIIQAFVQGDDVKLRGFGKFTLRQKRARPGRNPKTKETAIISARRVVTFSPSLNMRSVVNGEDAVDNDEE